MNKPKVIKSIYKVSCHKDITLIYLNIVYTVSIFRLSWNFKLFNDTENNFKHLLIFLKREILIHEIMIMNEASSTTTGMYIHFFLKMINGVDILFYFHLNIFE